MQYAQQPHRWTNMKEAISHSLVGMGVGGTLLSYMPAGALSYLLAILATVATASSSAVAAWLTKRVLEKHLGPWLDRRRELPRVTPKRERKRGSLHD